MLCLLHSPECSGLAQWTSNCQVHYALELMEAKGQPPKWRQAITSLKQLLQLIYYTACTIYAKLDVKYVAGQQKEERNEHLQNVGGDGNRSGQLFGQCFQRLGIQHRVHDVEIHRR